MEKLIILMLFQLMTMNPALAQAPVRDAAQLAKESCQRELETYCKAVSPGEGRTFACLYAHSDKLSGRCEYALYNVSKELEDAVSKLNHVADSCSDDLKKYCADTKPGEGRIVSCLQRNQDKTAIACQKSLQDTGMATVK
ncbi:MAG TPA: cysteine rich repeat-containing protein [Burkholderiales bacterium]|nr:cysteine rich repeat-containing protein [Burkholderiales bacterium]